MKSSEFERLGDWQRKQEWGFADALNDLEQSILHSPKTPSTCISTDRSTLQRKKKDTKIVNEKE